ncbi:MAG: hypothetical protein KIT74_08180 [Fimbriimonadales bacterium]|nr:hypothetical protein [Fimbriimonadales bacterium]
MLTQADADDLLAMDKYRTNNQQHAYPLGGGYLSIDLQSHDKSEKFILNISRGRIDLTKATHQTRAHKTIILARLDIAGPTHRNPDGVEVPCPHLHLYREGYGDKWAAPIDPSVFTNPNDLWQTLQEFITFCNIVDPPDIQKRLFV